eukprot:TRINITY_DN2559_c0_g1_i1.p1 TRINITY_DN2559_c0_g1~~TRINITY_DN2559_c0_g1_i1.p1  ORF type:complete len:383 (+),score=88.58 TRINITY_DN2559_c0_g1_i1:62-1210(+)
MSADTTVLCAPCAPAGRDMERRQPMDVRSENCESDQRPSEGLTETRSGDSTPSAEQSLVGKESVTDDELCVHTPYADCLELGDARDARWNLNTAPYEPLTASAASNPPPLVAGMTVRKKARALSAPPRPSASADPLPPPELVEEGEPTAGSPGPRPFPRDGSSERAARDARVRAGLEAGVLVLRADDTPLTADEIAKLHADTVVLTTAPADERRSGPSYKTGDWYCRSCGVHNFMKRTTCLACRAPRAAGHQPGPAEFAAGCYPPCGPFESSVEQYASYSYADWTCPHCGRLNYAKRTTCGGCYAEPFAHAGGHAVHHHAPHLSHSYPHGYPTGGGGRSRRNHRRARHGMHHQHQHQHQPQYPHYPQQAYGYPDEYAQMPMC